jgi:hypothetical protein
MFRVVMLPANQGDCIWLEYGDADDPHRVMIDGGPTYARPEILERLPEGPVHFELVVITHIDADHIGGVLEFLTNLPPEVTIGDIWFNGWKHLPSDVLGAAQGEMVSAVIKRRGIPWNAAFDGKAVCIPDVGDLPEVMLPGGLTVTVLSPSKAELRALRPVWKAEAEKAGITPGSTREAIDALRERTEVPADVLGADKPPKPDRDALKPFVSDTSPANGTSIVLLAEYDGKRILLTGDAFASLVQRGISRLTDRKLRLAALKLSHHASEKSTSRELLSMISCKRYLVSTNGSYYGHPDIAALSRVVVDAPSGTCLYFNYETSRTKRWQSQSLRERYTYSVEYPSQDDSGITVRL